MLEINNLTKSFFTKDGEITALDNISFTVKDGEFISIIGKSGSGKTTLLNILGGLDKPDRGTVKMGNTEITSLTESEAAVLRRKRIGIIYQFYNLIPELTVSENITLPRELSGEETSPDELLNILCRVGLQHRKNAYPTSLSGGEKQRVAIARALFNKPELILADEPTGNLDYETAEEIIKLLCDIKQELGVTILAVTHSKQLASAADRIITIEDGKIIPGRRT